MSDFGVNEEPHLTQAAEPIKAADFKDYYANHVRLGLTTFDVAITFGRIVEPVPNISRPEEQFTVRLSPQFFKAVLTNLNGLLAAFEGQFGEIKLSNKSAEEVLAGIKAAAEERRKK
jgi:hypothetical protein